MTEKRVAGIVACSNAVDKAYEYKIHSTCQQDLVKDKQNRGARR